MSKVPITARGAEKLREELQELKTVARPRVIQAIAEARAHGRFTIPSTLKVEKACNPFLRADQPSLRKRFGGTGASDADVLGAEFENVVDRWIQRQRRQG